MKIGFYRNHSQKWGGDLKILQLIIEGLKELGHEGFVTPDLLRAFQSDATFFSGTNWDQQCNMHFAHLIGKEYCSIPFHEERSISPGYANSFFEYISKHIYLDHSLDEFWENPHISLQHFLKYQFVDQREFLENAKLVIANSKTEEDIIRREAPMANIKTTLYPPGFVTKIDEEPTDDFLKFTGLKKSSYILQVGRIEQRKNQIGSLLACKDLDLPLVFIACWNEYTQNYLEAFLIAAYKWCKSRVYLISEKIPKKLEGCVKFIPMPHGKKLSKRLLLSAFANAGLYLQPAFIELPGLVYLEAARFGVPVIASEWCSICDYGLGERIAYSLPHDILQIQHLIKKLFGKFHTTTNLPAAFHRTHTALAKDIIQYLES